MIRIDAISMPLCHTKKDLENKVYKLTGDKDAKVTIFKKSVDARKKSDVHFVYSVEVECSNEAAILKKVRGAKEVTRPEFSYPKLKKSGARPVVVGTGPAGIFAALSLAHAGACPIVVERGAKVDKRRKAVDTFWKTGVLNTTANVQFGEGGAGTFSDGKLNTGIHSPLCRQVLVEYVRHGAPDTILYDAKPHIGTDNLEKIARSLREEIERLGGTFLFETTMTDMDVCDGKIRAVYAGGRIETNAVILACGHSARDTFSMLFDKGVLMSAKPFSVGVRIEHLQKDVNCAQYGSFWDNEFLPPADYKLASDCYTFCMCPGGYVVAAASESGGIVTNGMSEYARDGENANSALLVGVDERDFLSADPLAGIEFQRKIERAAFDLTGSFTAPCQTVEDFLKGKESRGFGSVTPTYKPGVACADINRILPARVTEKLKSGIEKLSHKMAAFLIPDAVLTAPETRSSSPVRILRDADSFQSNVAGLFPCGEGAGYAGGIMSSAVDGLKCAEKLIGWKNNNG